MKPRTAYGDVWDARFGEELTKTFIGPLYNTDKQKHAYGIIDKSLTFDNELINEFLFRERWETHEPASSQNRDATWTYEKHVQRH